MDKFEDWYFGKHSERTAFERSSANYHMAKQGWAAACEYMRTECIKKVSGWCESDNVAQRTVEAIRKIEA